MQFIDLKKQQDRIREKIDNNIKKVLDNGKYINGPEVKELEEKLADYVETKYAIGCSSGTDALLMPLMAYGVKPNDAIFCPTFTFIATAEVVELIGATPVFVDIESNTFNIDVKKLEEAIEKVIKEGKLNPKGIIPVDLFGQPADYDEINSIAKKYNLFVIEDAAQSFGATYKNKKACSLANVGATSFFPAKPFGCYGDGGMIFTDDKNIYDTLLSIRVHGQGSDKYDNIKVGLNGRLDTLQAAIMLAKFEIFEEEIELRQTVANNYNKMLSDIVKVPVIKKENKSAWAQYSILANDDDNRQNIMAKLKNENVPTAIYYKNPLHLQKVFSYLGYNKGDFPISEKISQQIFSLPFYPYLTKEEQEKISNILH